jgi:DNA-binding CsgD family transcriptional regulator
LNIAENSVEWHLKNIFRKLGVDSRVTAVVKALHLGLITL